MRRTQIADALTRHPGIAAWSSAAFRRQFDPRASPRQSARNVKVASRARGDRAPRSNDVTSLDEDRILRRLVNLIDTGPAHHFFQTGPDGHPRPHDLPSSSNAPGRRTRCCRARSTRSSSIRRASRAGICASARSRAAACAGPTGRRISAPRCSASSRRSRSRTRSSCRSAPRRLLPRSSCRRPPTAPPRSGRGCTESYRIFVRTLLELTDNLDGEKVMPPADTVRHDGDDLISSSPPTRAPRPSPTPPTRSRWRSGHWLGDAFASGGSQGYDHKKHGHHGPRRLGGGEAPFPRGRHRHPEHALHRGAGVWRHVRATSSATACCSRRRSSSSPAFDHPRHLPRPRAGPGRHRSPSAGACSTLPRSSWADYDKSLISAGAASSRARPRASRSPAELQRPARHRHAPRPRRRR